MPNEYFKGEQVRCTGTFQDADGAYVDPTAVFFKDKDPTGTVRTLQYGADVTLVRQSAGIYYAEVDADEVGHWYTKMYATGNGAAAAEGEFRVKSTRF